MWKNFRGGSFGRREWKKNLGNKSKEKTSLNSIMNVLFNLVSKKLEKKITKVYVLPSPNYKTMFGRTII